MLLPLLAFLMTEPVVHNIPVTVQQQETLENDINNLEPTIDLSAIRYIYCHDPEDKTGRRGWTGSGSIIADNVVLTALHVASGEHCIDLGTGKPLKMYDKDVNHDMALMTGDEPKIPYLKISCQPYRWRHNYFAYGVTDYLRPNPLFQQMILRGTGKHVDVTMTESGNTEKAMAKLFGITIPGMSGGPIVDEKGFIHGIVNAGKHDMFGFPTKLSFSYELSASKYCVKEI